MTTHEGNNAHEMLEIIKHNHGFAFASRGEEILAFASHEPVNDDGELTVGQYTLTLADTKSLRRQLDNIIETVQARRAASRRNRQ